MVLSRHDGNDPRKSSDRAQTQYFTYLGQVVFKVTLVFGLQIIHIYQMK